MTPVILRTFDSRTTIQIPPSSLHLEYTLKCGQVFRWTKWGAGYAGFLQNSPIHLSQNDGHVLALGSPDIEPILRSYFRLDDSLPAVIGTWGQDPALLQAVKAFPGLRLTLQGPWECLVSFVLSIVSNIPKIESGLEKLARHFGQGSRLMEAPFYSLPSAAALSMLTETTLRSFGIGFRAKFLLGCAQAIAAHGFPLESLHSLPYADAKRALVELPGIGEKVADCILLHGFGHLEAFPVDVWMKRILERYYFRGRQKTERYLSAWGRDRFGPNAGYAELYLYTFGRSQLDPQSPFFRLPVLQPFPRTSLKARGRRARYARTRDPSPTRSPSASAKPPAR